MYVDSNSYMWIITFPGRKLFGPGYSGLEYDYRGLLRLYNQVNNSVMAFEYGNILHNWNHIRDRTNAEDKKPLDFEYTDGCEEVVRKFFLVEEMSSNRASSLGQQHLLWP